MKNLDIIRAWKDEAYRASLSKEERAMLPENPAGELEQPGRFQSIFLTATITYVTQTLFTYVTFYLK